MTEKKYVDPSRRKLGSGGGPGRDGRGRPGRLEVRARCLRALGRLPGTRFAVSYTCRDVHSTHLYEDNKELF